MQNLAAALDTRTGQREHMTLVLRQPYLLPVRSRVDFKLAVLTYKALHGLALPYLSDDCLLAAEVGQLLRSPDVRTCVLPRTITQFDDRSFADTRTRVWNRLPAPLRDTNGIYTSEK